MKPPRRGRTAGTSLPLATPPATRRIAGLDALRGVAIMAMIAYHFAFDLRLFGFTSADFYRDPFWLNARTLILSMFLLLAGASLVLAQRSEAGRARFWLHVVRVAGCAALVSFASYVAFPDRFIWFGVLHAIAISLVLSRPLAAHPRAALAIGLVVIAAGNFLTSTWFDDRTLGWVGFMTGKPPTDDYVPLFPWAGVMLLGIAVAHLLARRAFRALAPFARLPRSLSWLGRHSLAVYMLHQPLLLAALYVGTRL